MTECNGEYPCNHIHLSEPRAGDNICKCGHHYNSHFLRQTPSNFQYTECIGGKIIYKSKTNKKRYNDRTKVFKQCLCDKFEQIGVIWKDVWDEKEGKFYDPKEKLWKEMTMNGTFITPAG